jgi:predicted XRE-type DNA-binding protein
VNEEVPQTVHSARAYLVRHSVVQRLANNLVQQNIQRREVSSGLGAQHGRGQVIDRDKDPPQTVFELRQEQR